MTTRLEFTKLQGCGNDYLFVDCREGAIERAHEVARAVSDRRFGVGSDGLILVCSSDRADFRMEMYNADGSRGEMCGNGIRGVGKFVADRGWTDADTIAVDTDAGVKSLRLFKRDGRVERVAVNMGKPILEGREIPVNADGRVLEQTLNVAGKDWKVSCVSMGNPHCVTFDVDPDGLDLERIGPEFENHEFFPSRVNTEFVRVDAPDRLRMRVWERGSGETMACGTGACAVAVAAALTGRAQRKVTVALLGGDLEIDYREDDTVLMTGPSAEVFSGCVELDLDGSPTGIRV